MLKERSVSPSTHGHPATIMPLWQSLHTMSLMLDGLVGFNHGGNNISALLTKLMSLEELLIDFRELEGEHSGENMAEAVWETLTCFGIENQVGAARSRCGAAWKG
jgi:hypothetical protein